MKKDNVIKVNFNKEVEKQENIWEIESVTSKVMIDTNMYFEMEDVFGKDIVVDKELVEKDDIDTFYIEIELEDKIEEFGIDAEVQITRHERLNKEEIIAHLVITDLEADMQHYVKALIKSNASSSTIKVLKIHRM